MKKEPSKHEAFLRQYLTQSNELNRNQKTQKQKNTIFTGDQQNMHNRYITKIIEES
jgi:hypothetical protein